MEKQPNLSLKTPLLLDAQKKGNSHLLQGERRELAVHRPFKKAPTSDRDQIESQDIFFDGLHLQSGAFLGTSGSMIFRNVRRLPTATHKPATNGQMLNTHCQASACGTWAPDSWWAGCPNQSLPFRVPAALMAAACSSRDDGGGRRTHSGGTGKGVRGSSCAQRSSMPWHAGHW